MPPPQGARRPSLRQPPSLQAIIQSDSKYYKKYLCVAAVPTSGPELFDWGPCPGSVALGSSGLRMSNKAAAFNLWDRKKRGW